MPKPKKNNPRPTPPASTAPSPHRYLFPFGALLLLLVLGGLVWFLLAEPPRLAAPQVAAAARPALPKTVPGHFNEQRFHAEGESTRLFRRGAEFWVNTPGADGKPADFKVAYTFGIEPLRHYLIETGQEPKAQALMQQWKQLNPGDLALQ